MSSLGPAHRVALWTAAIGAAGTILAATMGIVLSAKTKEFQQFRQGVGGVPGVTGRWHIKGRVDATPARGRNFTIYLVPGNKLMTTTDDKGFFSIDDVPAGSYQVLIRDDARNAMSSVIEPGQRRGELDMNNARAEWEVDGVENAGVIARPRELLVRAGAAGWGSAGR